MGGVKKKDKKLDDVVNEQPFNVLSSSCLLPDCLFNFHSQIFKFDIATTKSMFVYV